MDWNAFFSQYQYHVAWGVYLAASLIFCLFWWNLTRLVSIAGFRSLFRGFALVCMYTPWFVSDAHEYLAPALMVVVMDVLIGSSPNGLAAALALGGATFLMLVFIIARHFFFRKDRHAGVSAR